ncbi:MAG: fibronectin type III domain-containing protein [Prevotellaceae bacterium]|jgi:hypothetical protein|nr:fibronectin type III domain-containing protein [Prevotellaceae bacterium]
MKTYFKLKSFWLLLSLLVLGNLTVLGQTTFDLFNTGGSYTVTFPFVKDGITLTVTNGGNKNTTNQCNNGDGGAIIPDEKTYVLSFSSGGGMIIDAGAGKTIESIRFLVGQNSSGSTNDVRGQYAFSTDNATWTNHTDISARGYDYCNEISATAPAGAQYAYIGRGAIGGVSPSKNTEFRLFYVVVTIAGPSGPALTATPASYIDCLTKNIAAGGSTSVESFRVTGSDLDGTAVTVAPPAGFEVQLAGTGTWVANPATLTLPQSAGVVDTVLNVRIAASENTVGRIPATGTRNVTVSGGGIATAVTVAVCGEVVNLTPLSCATNLTIANVTYSTADFSWTDHPNDNGYIIKVYNGAVLEQTQTVGLNVNSYNISGLSQLTTYTVKLIVKGNGTTSGDSPECAATPFTTPKAPVSASVGCLTENFEGIKTDSQNQSERDTNGNNVLDDGSSNGKTQLLLPSGMWGVKGLRSITTAGRGISIHFRDVPCYLETPVLDNPHSITFFVKRESNSALQANEGLKVSIAGVEMTEVYIDGNPATFAAGLIQLPANSTTWYEVKAIVPAAQRTSMASIRIENGSSTNGRNRFYIDDVSVECSSMNLTAAPDAGGMNYVVDMGPSAIRTFTVTATDLGCESGTIELRNLGNFEVSFDSGATWSTGTTASFPYTSSSFAQLVQVRLKAGLSTADYTVTVEVHATGCYTKTPPMVILSGKVSDTPLTLPCGETQTVLNMKGTTSAGNWMQDYVLNTPWTSDGAGNENSHFRLSGGKSLTSPTVILGELDLKEISFYTQPTNSSGSNRVTVTLLDASNNVIYTHPAFTTPSKTAYKFTIDLSSVILSGSVKVRFTTVNSNHEIWDIVVNGVAKTNITLSTAMLSGFQSGSVDCPSASQTFVVVGQCMEEGNPTSNLTFTSNAATSQYEFSRDEITWGTTIEYTGKFPLAGMKIFVRQKGTAAATAFNASEVITVSNKGKGEASLMLSGNVTPPADMLAPDRVDFSSPIGVETIRSIDIPGGDFCQPLVASSNCSGLELANCEGGNYAATFNFDIDTDPANRKLYLKYTPGADLNCSITLTSGSFTRSFPLTWKGATTVTNGVATDNTNVKTVGGVGETNIWKAGGLPDETRVTITTTGGLTVSTGNPAYGDFVAMTETELGEMKGKLYIQGASGTVTITVAGGNTTTITVAP